jgi:hypothetical protein
MLVEMDVTSNISLPQKQYGSGWEAKTVHEELGDFAYSKSPAYGLVTECFGSTLRLKELKGIVYFAKDFLETHTGIKLPKISRNAKRSFPLLVKYIQANLDVMRPVLVRIEILDENRLSIPLLDSGRSMAQFSNNQIHKL